MDNEEKIYISKSELEKFKQLKEREIWFECGMDIRLNNIFFREGIRTLLDFCSLVATYPPNLWRGMGQKTLENLETYFSNLGIEIEGLNSETKTVEEKKEKIEKLGGDLYENIIYQHSPFKREIMRIAAKLDEVIDKINKENK